MIADANVPDVYQRAFQLVDPDNSGETSVNSLSRVLGTSSLPASQIDKIVNLVSSKPRVSRLEFFVALALVALAQSGKDVSIEQVAALSSQNTLPEPNLDLTSLPPSNSTFVSRAQSAASTARSPPPQYSYSTDDPWSTPKAPSNIVPKSNNTSTNTNTNSSTNFGGPANSTSGWTNGAPSSLSGSGLPTEWWKKQETVKVTLLGQQGFILNRYFVYQVETDRGTPVTRRYSEFVYLWECLTRRYPFRLFPALPPKRIGADEHFLEQRRRGLTRALNFVINHPVIKDDGVLASFLSEAQFDHWRKATNVSLEEESASKRVDRNEEMSIPSDLEEKLAAIRSNLNIQIELWQRICIISERLIKRQEAAASDLSRLTNTLRAAVEVTEQSWRSAEDELAQGVRQGLVSIAAHTQRQSELSDIRSRTLLDTTLESLKAQRDLHLATRDLFIRHEHLSRDSVERLKKRVESGSTKLETIKKAQKEGWQDEADKILSSIEQDQATIAAQLNRRVFIRACMWHELRVVLHNRENTLLTLAAQNFAREEQDHAENVMNAWSSLVEAIENMPVE